MKRVSAHTLEMIQAQCMEFTGYRMQSKMGTVGLRQLIITH